MIIQHLPGAENNVHIYRRRYEGDGVYKMKVTCEQVEEGDSFASFTTGNTLLKVIEVLSCEKSKGKKMEGFHVCELRLLDEAFKPDMKYEPLRGM